MPKTLALSLKAAESYRPACERAALLHDVRLRAQGWRASPWVFDLYAFQLTATENLGLKTRIRPDLALALIRLLPYMESLKSGQFRYYPETP
jgi:hypothetical protein